MLLKIINIIWIIFQLFIGIQLVFPVVSYILYSLLRKKPVQNNNIPEEDYAIIVTAYKDTGNLPNVVQSLLKLNYSNYLIYIVADNCEVMEKPFTDPRVITLYPETVFSNQVKSHFYAVSNFKRAHNKLTIIDSDNLVDPNYLHELNKYFAQGFKAVQGVRTAKNLDTIYACIDATNEIYYLFYDRKILFGIGSSSMLTGSGMAFTVDLYKECLGNSTTEGAGFDKVLQKEILTRGYRIAFAEDAIVYDEKTSKSDQLVKQRARWNNTWFRFFKYGFTLMGKGIMNLNWNQFSYGFLLVRPPLFILLILSFLIMAANVFINVSIAAIWAVAFIVFVFGFFLALAKSKTDKRIYKSLTHIPKFVFFQVLSLFKTRRANQHSVATEHFYNKDIEEVAN